MSGGTEGPGATQRNAAGRLLASQPRAALLSVAGLAAAGLAGAALLAWLVLLAEVVDRAFVDGDRLGDLRGPLVAMAALLIVRAAAGWAGTVLAAKSSAASRTLLRSRLTASVITGDPRRLGGARTGRVSGALTEGVEAVGDWVSGYLPAMAMTVVVPAMAFVAVLLLDWPSTLILAFTGPMLVLLLAVIGRRTAELTRRRFDELGWLRGFYLDMLRGLGTLKAFGRSSDGAEMIEQTSRRFGDTTMEVLRTAFQTSLVMEWASTAATALVAVEVSFRLIRGDITFGTALAVLVVTPEFFTPFRRLSTEYHVGRTGDAAAEEISELLGEAQVDLTGPRTAAPVSSADHAGPPRIEVRSLHYRYPGAEKDALDGVDLSLEPGEVVAVVGPSGAGKSTLASVLLRFVEPTSGEALVDGQPLSGIDATQWRRRLAWVPQAPTMLAGTVADNIALGAPGADRAQIERAAQAAGADEFIAALPDGYDTVLGERGLRLSGGQRQRIAIARATIVDAPLIVFDEFTAHLDSETEAAVLDAARKLWRGRTVIVIAHREATIAAADRVVTLRKGAVSAGRAGGGP
ncbi:MAG: thiol reductant ABC exporter subunit CydD [Actinomycetia bacterium]|nr:thiol reductant ABC exporter subunit CydD [Actinomycetes bacterium]